MEKALRENPKLARSLEKDASFRYRIRLSKVATTKRSAMRAKAPCMP